VGGRKRKRGEKKKKEKTEKSRKKLRKNKNIHDRTRAVVTSRDEGDRRSGPDARCVQ
jgi:hypothetical protein